MPRTPLSRLGLAFAAMLPVGAAVVRASVIYSTGFEPPVFSTGQLTPQQSWTTTASVFSAQAAAVSEANPRAGSQGVAIDATFIPQTDWFFRPLGHAVDAAEPVVRVSVDMFLTNTALNSAGWGIDCYDALGVRIGQFYVDATGIGYISNGIAAQAAALAGRNHWSHFVLTLDYASRRFSLGLDGQAPIGSMAFNGAAGTSLGDADFRVFGAGTDTAYFDNFMVEAVPGAGAGAIGLAGAGGLIGMRRRRSRG